MVTMNDFEAEQLSQTLADTHLDTAPHKIWLNDQRQSPQRTGISCLKRDKPRQMGCRLNFSVILKPGCFIDVPRYHCKARKQLHRWNRRSREQVLLPNPVSRKKVGKTFNLEEALIKRKNLARIGRFNKIRHNQKRLTQSTEFIMLLKMTTFRSFNHASKNHDILLFTSVSSLKHGQERYT